MDHVEDHLDKLPIFLATVRARSIRGAAKALGKSQPAVSRTLRLLEEAAGARLFVRAPAGIQLTATGQRMFEFADHVRAGLARFRAHAGDDKPIREQVSFGMFESIAVYLLPGFLRYAADAQNRLEISVHTAPSRALFDALRRSELDLVLSVSPPAHRSVRSTVLFTDEYRIYRHPSVSPSARTPLLVFEQAADAKGKTIASYVQSSRHARRRRFECASFEAVAALTVAGLGLGILPSRVAERSLSGRELVEVDDTGGPWRFGRHPIAVSCLNHRLGDAAILWIHRALEQFEGARRV
ncbi:MAG TPA: LysR family transcriptional regulator [Kofleriaceae bacterium]|jgi:DNA-binding transcriptional LysR family regulator